MKSKLKALLREWVPTILIAVILSIGIRIYIAEAMWIPSGSMLPTLGIGDRLLVEKVSFKFNQPVERGEIVVFTPPADSQLTEKILIKRVIGLPGETILIKDGVVYINDVALDEPYLMEETQEDFGPYKIPQDCGLCHGGQPQRQLRQQGLGTCACR